MGARGSRHGEEGVVPCLLLGGVGVGKGGLELHGHVEEEACRAVLIGLQEGGDGEEVACGRGCGEGEGAFGGSVSRHVVLGLHQRLQRLDQILHIRSFVVFQSRLVARLNCPHELQQHLDHLLG